MRTKTQIKPHTLNDLARVYLNNSAKIYFNNPKQGVLLTPTDEAPSLFLSRCGLKTPGAVKMFLNTPTGKKIIAEMIKTIAIKKSFEEYITFEQREHDLLMHRIKAALFLYYLEKEALASDRINQEANAQIEKALHKKVPQVNAEHLANLQKVIDAVLTKQNSLKDEEAELLAAVDLLEQQGEEILEKYMIYEELINDELFTSYVNADASIIKNDQKELERQTEELYQEINQMIKENAAPALLFQKIQKQMAFNLKWATLDELLAVKGGKKYVDDYGNEVKTPKDAAFILEKTDKLIYENGKYYLLKGFQDLDTVKNNPEALHKAMELAQKNLTVKKVININKGIEETTHRVRLQDKKLEIGLNQAAQRLVTNQIQLLESARAKTQAALISTPKPSISTPRPSVNPTVTLSNHSSSTSKAKTPTISYKEELKKLKEGINPSDLMSLAKTSAEITTLLRKGTRLNDLPHGAKMALFQRMETLDAESPITQQQETTKTTPFKMTPDPYN